MRRRRLLLRCRKAPPETTHSFSAGVHVDIIFQSSDVLHTHTQVIHNSAPLPPNTRKQNKKQHTHAHHSSVWVVRQQQTMHARMGGGGVWIDRRDCTVLLSRQAAVAQVKSRGLVVSRRSKTIEDGDGHQRAASWNKCYPSVCVSDGWVNGWEQRSAISWNIYVGVWAWTESKRAVDTQEVWMAAAAQSTSTRAPLRFLCLGSFYWLQFHICRKCKAGSSNTVRDHWGGGEDRVVEET